MRRIILLSAVVFVLSGAGYSQGFKGVPAEDEKMLRDVLSSYHRGVTGNDPKLARSTIGEEFIIFSGDSSDDPTGWQAHLFRTGKGLKIYLSNYIKGAAPHENKFEVVHMYVRSDAAVVVTKDTGKNKFREWKDESVTWLAGKRDGAWKLTGYYLRGVKNPE